MTQRDVKLKGSHVSYSEDWLEVEEQREASLPDVDDKNIVVLCTNELAPVLNVTSNLVDGLIHILITSTEWQELYEAMVMLRRVMVHHNEVITSNHVEKFVQPLAIASNSLRSAPSKNGLLACAECLEFVPRLVQERALLGGASFEMLDVLLRRSVCEKKFLRDAAQNAVQKLATHLAGLPLLAAVARYGSNKNGKLCGVAATIIARSLERLVQTHQTLSYTSSGSLDTVFRALAAFRESKDASARLGASTSFQHLSVLVGGVQALERGLRDALTGAKEAGLIACIMKDASTAGRRGKAGLETRSLRKRIQMKC